MSFPDKEPRAQVEEASFESDLYIIAKVQLARQEIRYGTRIVALADVDDTTYSHRRSNVNSSQYTDTLQQRDIPDTRITGRHFHEYLEYINSHKITGVPPIASIRNGTIILLAKPKAYDKWNSGIQLDEHDFVEDLGYSQQLSALGFDKRSVLSSSPDFISGLKKRIPNVWIDHQLADREENLEKWGMISDRNQVIYDIEVPFDMDQVEVQKIIQEMAEGMYHGFSIVLMDVGPAQQGKLDGVAYGLFILPQGVGKHTANEYIIKSIGATSACILGDALNDETALTHSYTVPTYKGIVGGYNRLLTQRLGVQSLPKDKWQKTQYGFLYIENNTSIGPESARQIIVEAHEMAQQRVF